MAVTITVQAGEHGRQDCPMRVVLDAALVPPSNPVLRVAVSGTILPCQVERRGEKATLSWILPDCAAGSSVALQLESGSASATDAGVQLKPSDGAIAVDVAGASFTTFHYGDAWSRPFMHPVIGPYGQPLTRAYPVIADVPGESQDHPHHKSFWVAWGEVNGTDNWSENAAGHAKQRVVGVPACVSGPVYGRIACALDWVSEQGVKVLSEERDIVVWNVPSTGRAVDLRVTFKATEGAVDFGDTKEGGICSIRVASSMDASSAGTIVNSFGGRNEAETWGKRAHWCDYVGPVGGQTVGISIFDHPANFRHPTPWHVRNYGLMTANPFGLSHFLNDPTKDGSHRLAAGAELTFRYRIYFHAGDTVAADVAGKYHDFITPPVAVTA